MEIKNSLEWNSVHSVLQDRIINAGFNRDLISMLKNIGIMVRELSKAEVDARRNKSTLIIDKLRGDINNAIDRIEKLLIIMTLSK